MARRLSSGARAAIAEVIGNPAAVVAEPESAAATWTEWTTGNYATTGTTTNCTTWTCWITASAGTSCTVNSNVWYDWNTTSGISYGNSDTYQESDEARLAREQRYAERRAAEQAAQGKAAAILKRHLDAEQAASWDAQGHFDLTVEGGDKPARHYRIKRGAAGNIKRLENGEEVESLCVHPRGVPDEDANLAQMLHLLHNEDELRRTANITPLRRTA